MAEPTNELMMQVLIALREEMASQRESLASFRTETLDRFDVFNERMRQLETTMHEGFATLTVAHRRSDDFLRAVDREAIDLKARVVALELRVSELERQD